MKPRAVLSVKIVRLLYFKRNEDMRANIENYPDYHVSKDGRVYSFKSKKWLKPRVKKNGYLQVNLSWNGKQNEKSIHRLVAKAYLPNPLKLPCVMHLDDDRINNHISNLRWATHQENMKDQDSKGRQAKGEHHGMYGNGSLITGDKHGMFGVRLLGEKNPNAKLSNIQRTEIQHKYKTGTYSHRKLAVEYGISKTQIARVINNIK